MAKKKSPLSNPIVQEIVAGLIWFYMQLVKRTVRWEVRGMEHVDAFWNNPMPAVLCFWHGRVVGLLSGWRLDLVKPVVLISKSEDGDMISRTARMLGVKAVRGSSRNPKKEKSGKGGKQALEDLIAMLKQGEAVVITPDGPRGPRYRAKPGAAAAAVETNSPVLVCGFSARSMKVLGSWDRQVLVRPFTRGVFVWHPMIYPPTEGTRAEKIALMREQIETALHKVNREADESCGRIPIEPEAPYQADADASAPQG